MKNWVAEGITSDVNDFNQEFTVPIYFSQFFDMHIVFQNKIDDGQVILVNSMSGHRLSPLGGKTRFYSATKFAVNALLEVRLTN